jgi:hypothetical protein
MGSRVDAARETRHHAEAGGADVAGEAFGHFHPRGGGVARTDHGDQGTAQHGGITADREERRRVVDDLEVGRIVGLAERDEAGANARGGRNFLLGLFAAADTQLARRTAAARQLRQRRKRSTGTAAMIDEGAECRFGAGAATGSTCGRGSAA